MSNLKIYKKVGRKIAVIGGAMLLSASLIGCGNKKDSLLKNTLLEQSRVITLEDGHKDVVIHEQNCQYHDGHSVYKSIITNEYIIDEACRQTHMGFEILEKYTILNDESIISYLTDDEIIKASNGKLTKEDVTNILVRIVTESQEKTKENTK